MDFTRRGRGAVAALILALAFSLMAASAAQAGELVFTAADAARQAAFIKAMDGAADAARRGDRAGAQAGLRNAIAASGGGLGASFIPSAAACGQPAFVVPAWLLTAQAEIGDMAGAKASAKSFPSAYATLEGLNSIARTQTRTAPDTRPYIFSEAIPRKDPEDPFDAFDYRKHDYSALQRLRLPPNPARAAAILREGVPYAAAVSRSEASYWANPSMRYGFLPPDSGYRSLVKWQQEIGDSEGMKSTVASLPTPARRAILLLLVAHDQRRTNRPVAAATEKSALALTPQIEKSGPRDRGAFYSTLGMVRQWRGDSVGARDAFSHCAGAVRQLPTARERYDGLNHLAITLSAPPDDTRGTPADRAADRTMMRTLLLEMRGLIAQMTEPAFVPPPVPKGQESRFVMAYNPQNPPRAIQMYSIASQLANEGNDMAGVRETLALARDLALMDADTKRGAQCLMMIERGAGMLERQATRRGQ